MLLVSAPHMFEMVPGRSNNVAVVAAVACWRCPRRQGYEADSSIGADCHRGQSRVMIDDIQYLRLNVIDLAIDCGDLSGIRGVDILHQGGFMTQETEDVIDIVEGLPGEPLVSDGIMETG